MTDSFTSAKQLFLEGLAKLQAGNLNDAEDLLQASLRHFPDRVSTLINLSAVQIKLGKFADAAETAERAIGNDAGVAQAWLNWGSALVGLKEFAESLVCLDRALTLDPNSAEAWSTKGAALYGLRRFNEAIAHHDRAIALKPQYAEAWTNKGLVLRDTRKLAEALRHHEKAATLAPNYAEAWVNAGLTLYDWHRSKEAVECFDKAIAIKADHAEPWMAKALALVDQGMHVEALPAFDRAIEIDPTLAVAAADAIHARLQAGVWNDLAPRVEDLVERISARHQAISPFTLLSIVDSPQLQLQAARNWVDEKYPARPERHPPGPYHHRKIRVGYFSSDFRGHAVAYLAAELFERHDRRELEILGISLRAADKDDSMRPRLRSAFDRFIEAEALSDVEVVELARELEIDIAVDLGGHTRDARTGVFAYRAAPVQVNFLGFPATMGADYIDYIIADRIVIPEETRHHYAEKVVYLPGCFQPNDSRRPPAEVVVSRARVGLPASGFIFCCFNNIYKINPQVFDTWMNILRSAEGAFLWLLANSASVETHYRRVARASGVDPDRLIFAGRVAPEEYRGRYRLADLALDTLPFNAGTTASDALWEGLPVLTQAGKSFCGRMATSLLSAIGLPELITSSRGEYESVAIAIATESGRAEVLKRKLAANRAHTPLFDTARYARHLERAFTAMHERSRAGLAPEHLTIA